MLVPNLLPEFEAKPRVFVRKMGGEYLEIAGVKSFERNDHGSAGAEISFVIAEKQDDAVKRILQKESDGFIDVKIELSLGSLMVMKFSGQVEHYSGGAVSFALSSDITTDVVETPDTLH
ncbi:MAG: hypothetical protein H6R01_1565 [Burkholderiaceae bacterium]|nr:hypothetical protein [Burkholderiaceae bacterium]